MIKWHLIVAASAAVALCPALTCGQSGRPIRLVVVAVPGGTSDFAARLIAPRLSEALRQNVIVDNKPSANGIVAAEIVAKATPDGLTLGVGNSGSHAINAAFNREVVRILKLQEFKERVAPEGREVVANTPEQFAAVIKTEVERYKKIVAGSSGAGGSSHLAMELLKIMTKIDMTHVPYKGGGPALNDLFAGQVNIYSGTAIILLPFVKVGRLKALGVASAKRLQPLPDIPAIAETIPGYESDSWQGVLVPVGTPSAIIELLNREIAKIMRSPEVIERLATQGAEPVARSSAEFGAYIKAEIAKYSKLIKAAGIKPE